MDLTDRPTAAEPRYTSGKDYKKQLKKHVKKLSSLQRLHYASDHWSLLVIFQGMDAAGKDGGDPPRHGVPVRMLSPAPNRWPC